MDYEVLETNVERVVRRNVESLPFLPDLFSVWHLTKKRLLQNRGSPLASLCTQFSYPVLPSLLLVPVQMYKLFDSFSLATFRALKYNDNDIELSFLLFLQ